MTEKIPPTSSWTLPATGRQLSAIARLCTYLKIQEPLEEKPMNRWEARRLMHDLNEKRKATVHKADQPT